MLLPHLRRQYHSLLPILTVAVNLTQTLSAASPQNTIPLLPVYPHSWQGISLRHWLLPHLRGEYHSLLSILTQGREYHSDTGCCLTSGDNTTPSCLSSLGEGISLRHCLLPHLIREYHSLLSILTAGRVYHSDTGCCLTSRENTTPSCLPSLRGLNITQTLAAVSPQETIKLPPAYPHSGWEYHSDTGCCLTSGDNTTPSCLSPLGEGISLRHWLLPNLRRQYHSLLSIVTRGGNITQTLAAASPQETVPLPPVYRHLGEGISLRHWLLPHLRREYHSLLSILTAGREYHSDTGCCLTSGDNTTSSCLSSLGGRNITQTLAAASPQETIPLPPAYPHWGREYHSDTGCCLTSGDNTTPSCLSSLGEGISLRHWLLPHLRRQYHSLLPILTQGREYHSDTGCCLTSEYNTTPYCLSSLWQGTSLRHWLLPHPKREYHSLLPILTAGREYHSDTGCCLTSRENTTPSCLSSLRLGNITQTLATASPQETIPLPPVYPHSGREYHSDTGCCLTSGDNSTRSCLSSLRGGNITQTLAAASPQERIPLPPAYPHCGEGISLRHWLLPQFRRQYHSLLSILTAGREYHSDTPCCLTSGDNTTPSCLSSLGVGISLRHWLLPHLRRQCHSLLSILTRGGNITQTLAAA